MNKWLAVFAVLAASCIAATAFADGETPAVKGNIEVYGAAKLSVDRVDTGGKAPADTSLTKVSSNSSRLGFKGKEELSDDLSAVVQVEMGVNMDGTTSDVVSSVTTSGGQVTGTKTAGTNQVTLRNTYAGLSSKTLGTLIFGIHDTPYKLATGKLDAFGDSMGDYNAIIGNVNGSANFDLRPKDVIAYMTPVWSGLQIIAASVQTGTESSNGADSNPYAFSGAALYNGGPLFASLAYEVHKNGITSWDSGDKITGTKLGAGYVISDTTLGFVYEALKDDKADSKYSRNAYYLAVSQKFGKETVKLAYGLAGDGEDPATKTGASQVTVGIDHAFSKRTTVYVLYSAMKNDKNATYGLGQSGAGGAYVPGAGEDPSVVSLGIVHAF